MVKSQRPLVAILCQWHPSYGAVLLFDATSADLLTHSCCPNKHSKLQSVGKCTHIRCHSPGMTDHHIGQKKWPKRYGVLPIRRPTARQGAKVRVRSTDSAAFAEQVYNEFHPRRDDNLGRWRWPGIAKRCCFVGQGPPPCLGKLEGKKKKAQPWTEFGR